MATDQLMSGGGPQYVQMHEDPSTNTVMSPLASARHSCAEPARIFDELPEATIVSVSRPDAADISPMLLTYTIQFRYKQVRSHFFFLFKILYDS